MAITVLPSKQGSGLAGRLWSQFCPVSLGRAGVSHHGLALPSALCSCCPPCTAVLMALQRKLGWFLCEQHSLVLLGAELQGMGLVH